MAYINVPHSDPGNINLPDSQIIIGQVEGVGEAKPVSGAITLTDTGAVALSASAVDNSVISGSANISLNKLAAVTGNHALISNASGFIDISPTSSTELSYLSGVTSNVQTQLNGKLSAFGYTPEDVANKDTTVTLGTSDTKYPSQKAVKTYVDTNLSIIPTDTKEPTGFVDASTTTISVVDGTRTFTVAPTGASFDVYVKGVKYTKTSQSVVFTNTEGVWYFYFDNTGTLTASQTVWDLSLVAPVSLLYWDATNTVSLDLADERHGCAMDWATHKYLHSTVGTRLVGGLGASGYVLNSAVNADVQFAFDSGSISDEDLVISIAAQTEPAQIPVFYRSGVGGNWRRATATNYPYLTAGTGRIAYNLNTAGTWSQAEVTNTDFTAYWIFATDGKNFPIISIQGQRTDTSLNNALNNNLYESLSFGTLPYAEMKLLFRVIVQTSNAYGSTMKVRIVDVQDLRVVSNLPSGSYVATDHNSLTGRSTAGSHPATAISNTPAGNIAATDVQSALNELDTEKQAALGYTPINKAGETGIGTLQLNGNLGIGIVATQKLQVHDSTGGSDNLIMSSTSAGESGYMQANAGGSVDIGSLTSHPLRLMTGAAAAVTVATDGRVGIGATPADKFQVNITASDTGILLTDGGANYNPRFQMSRNGSAKIRMTAASGVGHITGDSGLNLGGTLDTAQVYIDATGKVGIGMAPQCLVDAEGASDITAGQFKTTARFKATAADIADKPGIMLGYNNAGTSAIIAAATQATGQPIGFWTFNGSSWGERLQIAKTGEVGIGTDPGGYKLNVNGATQLSGNVDLHGDIYFKSDTKKIYSLDQAKSIQVSNSGVILTGNVGIGTTPTSTLGGLDISSGGLSLIVGADSGASTRTNATTKLGRVGGAHYTNAEEPIGLLISSSDSTDNIVSIGGGSAFVNAATRVRIMTAANSTTTGGTERLNIDSSGTISIPGTTNIGSSFSGNGALNVNGDIKVGGGNRVIGNYGNNSISLRTNDTDRLTVGADGTITVASGCYLGVGGTPAVNLDVIGTGSVISTVRTTSTSGTRSAIFRLNEANTGGSDGAGQLLFTYDTDYKQSAAIKSVLTGGGSAGILKFYTSTTERMQIDSDGRISGSSAIHRALSSTPDSTSGTTPYLESGTFTPAGTTGTNVTVVTPGLSTWMRVGRVVTVSGQVSITTTAAASSSCALTFPINSNIATDTECSGVFSSLVAGSGRIIGDATNDRTTFEWTVTATGSNSYRYTYTYLVN